MLEIGSSLRDARRRQGLEYARIEAALRIRSRYLAALEEERFDALPGRAYAKSFLREYAEFLGLDGRALLDEYEDRFEREEDVLPPPVRAPARRWPPRRARLAAAGATLLVVLVVLLVLGLTNKSHPLRRSAALPPPATSTTSSPKSIAVPITPRTPRSRPVPRPATPVSLHAIRAYDPFGDGQEHDADSPFATDGNEATYWRTETYQDGLLKAGVGLVLDAERSVHLVRLVLTTDTPGFTALVEAGPAPDGPFRAISSARTVTPTTAFPLGATAERYYVVWITRLVHTAHVNEVRALAG